MFCEILSLDILLRILKRTPDVPPSELCLWHQYRNRHHPFSPEEIEAKKAELRRMAPSAFYSIYPEEKPGEP
jgi:hypothetical protein